MGIGDLLGGAGSIVQVILGVGLLIFIHEAGHFLAAKWAGVKVLAFSLGFGPELFGVTRGPTRYRVSWIPLGGYVKMSGEVERPEGGFAPDDYPSQPVGKRAIIIGAGVAMNAVLGFVLYAAAFLWGMPADPVLVSVATGGPAWEEGLRTGDRILAVDGHRAVDFGDVVHASLRDGPARFEVERDGRRMEIAVTPRLLEDGEKRGFGVAARFGNLLDVPPGGDAEKAGFRTGDRVVAIEGVPAAVSDLYDEDFASALLPAGGPLRVQVRRGTEIVEIPVPPAPRGVPRIGVAPLRSAVRQIVAGSPALDAGWRPGDRPAAVGERPVRGASSFRRAVMGAPAGAAVRVERTGGPAAIPIPDGAADRLDLLRDLHLGRDPSPTAVEVLAEGPPGPDGRPSPSPAEAAGIPNGARITSVDGAAIARFEDIRKRLAEAKAGPVEIAWVGPTGSTGSARVAPALHPFYGLAVGIVPDGEVRAGSVGEAVSLAAHRCVLTTRNIGLTLSGIFKGSVDKGNLGGPVLIAQATFQKAKEGFGHFLWILAMLSINLMFLNVLPIPLLDGGQLALLAVEGVTRRRPSDSVVGITQMAGLVFLLGVLVFVTFNDIARLVGG
jgi:regulator of sigma E protease